MESTRLLLLSGACLVGQNILAALDGRRGGLHLSAINSVAAEPALFDFDEVFLSGNLRDDPDAFARRFGEVLATVGPHLVLPCRDDDVAFLARFAETRPASSAKFLCGASAPAEAMLDKQASWQFSRRHGLPFAPTTSCDGDASTLAHFAAEHGFPLVAKPRQGYASRGVFLVLDAAQLERLAGRGDYIVQQYLGDGDAVHDHARRVALAGIPLFHSFEAVKLSIQAFIAPDGHIAGLFATRNTMRQGRSERVARDDDPTLAALGRQCATAFAGAGWCGPLNIQCQRAPSGELMIYEYNGRCTGATAARRLLGYDELGLALEQFCGIAGRGHGEGAVPREVVRLPSSRAIDADAVARLETYGHWRAG